MWQTLPLYVQAGHHLDFLLLLLLASFLQQEFLLAHHFLIVLIALLSRSFLHHLDFHYHRLPPLSVYFPVLCPHHQSQERGRCPFFSVVSPALMTQRPAHIQMFDGWSTWPILQFHQNQPNAVTAPWVYGRSVECKGAPHCGPPGFFPAVLS